MPLSFIVFSLILYLQTKIRNVWSSSSHYGMSDEPKASWNYLNFVLTPIQLAAYSYENSLMMYMIIFFIQLTFILLQVEKNGIDNEYVPGITTSKYLINKLRELAKVGTYKVIYIKLIWFLFHIHMSMSMIFHSLLSYKWDD